MSLFEVEEYPYQLFFKVAFSTGMRKGELLALTWEDVDFSRQTINVNKTLVRLPDGQMSFHPPKTKSGYRSITIHKSLTQELQAWRYK
ncbi:site-specific integrase [Lactococcus cremoris]